MNFTSADRRNLLECLKKDTNWLSKRRLIDYSLLIGVERIDTNEGEINSQKKSKKTDTLSFTHL